MAIKKIFVLKAVKVDGYGDSTVTELAKFCDQEEALVALARAQEELTFFKDYDSVYIQEVDGQGGFKPCKYVGYSLVISFNNEIEWEKISLTRDTREEAPHLLTHAKWECKNSLWHKGIIYGSVPLIEPLDREAQINLIKNEVSGLEIPDWLLESEYGIPE